LITFKHLNSLDSSLNSKFPKSKSFKNNKDSLINLFSFKTIKYKRNYYSFYNNKSKPSPVTCLKKTKLFNNLNQNNENITVNKIDNNNNSPLIVENEVNTSAFKNYKTQNHFFNKEKNLNHQHESTTKFRSKTFDYDSINSPYISPQERSKENLVANFNSNSNLKSCLKDSKYSKGNCPQSEDVNSNLIENNNIKPTQNLKSTLRNKVDINLLYEELMLKNVTLQLNNKLSIAMEIKNYFTKIYMQILEEDELNR